jgi:hypothetical protein
MEIIEVNPIEVPVACRHAAQLAGGLVCERLGLPGTFARWYQADKPIGEVEGTEDGTVWLRVMTPANPIELSYAIAYQLAAQAERRRGTTNETDVKLRAASWADQFMASL